MKFFDRILTIVITATLTSAAWIIFGGTAFEMAGDRQAEDPDEAAETPVPVIETPAPNITPSAPPIAAEPAPAEPTRAEPTPAEPKPKPTVTPEVEDREAAETPAASQV